MSLCLLTDFDWLHPAAEKFSHDHLDDLVRCCKEMVRAMDIVPAMLEADIAKAFRRIPLMSDHAWAAGVP